MGPNFFLILYVKGSNCWWYQSHRAYRLSVPSQPLSLPNFTSPTITQANFFCPFIKPFLLPADQFSYFHNHLSSLFSLWFVNLSLRKMSAGVFAFPAVAGSGYHGLKALPTKQLFPSKNSVARSSKTVSNGSKTFCMKVIWLNVYVIIDPCFLYLLAWLNLMSVFARNICWSIDMESNQQQEVRGSVLPASSYWRFNCEGDWLHDEKRMDPLPRIRRGKPKIKLLFSIWIWSV